MNTARRGKKTERIQLTALPPKIAVSEVLTEPIWQTYIFRYLVEPSVLKARITETEHSPVDEDELEQSTLKHFILRNPRG